MAALNMIFFYTSYEDSTYMCVLTTPPFQKFPFSPSVFFIIIEIF
jgi:hypothetical protein